MTPVSNAAAEGWAAKLTTMRHVWTSVRSAAGLPAAIPSPAEWGNAMDSMERSQAAIVSSGGWTAGPSNLLEVLGMERAEVANCQVVRWLWDPAARHGLGAELLARLAAHLELRLSDPTSVRVRAEVTKPDSRADLVLYGLDDGELIVEAKVDAAEQPQQGLRLEEDWPNAAGFVFLTIRGDRLPWTAKNTARWSRLDWRWIADSVIAAVTTAPAPTDHRASEARHAAHEWALAARRHLE
jgi:hypothetical protein